jgi:lysozyme
MNNRLRDLLIRDEGVRAWLYDDATGKPLKKGDTLLGHPSVGIGRNCGAVPFSHAVIEHMLDEDVATCEAALGHYSYFAGLNEARKAVCLSLAFNVGINGYAKFLHFNAALIRGNFAKAAAEIRASGIAPARRERLAVQMETGYWDGKKPAFGQHEDVGGQTIPGGGD